MKAEKTNKELHIWTWVLFIIYLLLLVWAILFKFGRSWPRYFGYGIYRSPINLVPFGAPMLSGGRIDWTEMAFNVLAFFPFGLFLSLLGLPRRAWMRVLIGMLVSIAFEALQYAFGLGSCDITDVILNTVGTALGVGAYYLVKLLLKDKTEAAVDIAVTALALLFIAFNAACYFAR